jgi:hypothetical protein
MNLLKVQDKLKAREYRTIEEVLDHIQLVWDNCKAYNPEGHYYVLADKMERQFKKMIRNYLPNIQVVIPSNSLRIQNLLARLRINMFPKRRSLSLPPNPKVAPDPKRKSQPLFPTPISKLPRKTTKNLNPSTTIRGTWESQKTCPCPKRTDCTKG